MSILEWILVFTYLLAVVGCYCFSVTLIGGNNEEIYN